VTMTRILQTSNLDYLSEALKTWKSGGLVAFPTDTVYGLGAPAFDGRAVQGIYIAKDRPAEKAIPLLIAEGGDLDTVAAHVPLMARRLAARFWPGPLTVVTPKRATLPRAVSATGTVGVRVPDHEVARALLRAAGPLAVSSANLSNQASPCNAQEVFAQLNGRIDLIVDGGSTPGGQASTVVDCTGPQPVILRAGPVTLDEILKAL
jgi:L-threonylcarbamoyladenylate synthase